MRKKFLIPKIICPNIKAKTHNFKNKNFEGPIIEPIHWEVWDWNQRAGLAPDLRKVGEAGRVGENYATLPSIGKVLRNKIIFLINIFI